MDIVQLKTLIHVAELGSLSKAADRLNIAQPALSRQIRMLERELGVYLFDRHGRGMVITAMGREVLDHAVRVMAELESIRTSASRSNVSFKGAVKVGTTPTVAEITTVPLVRRIQSEHPDLDVRFSSAFSGYLLDWLLRGELDVMMSYDPQPMKSVRIVPVMLETLQLIAPGSDELHSDEPLHFAQLADRKLIMPSPRHGLRAILDDCARQAGIKLRASIEVESFGAMIDLVRNGFGVTVLPPAPVHAQIASGALRAAPLIDPCPVRKLVLIYPSERPVGPAARFVGEAFAGIAADLVERRIWLGKLL